MFMAFRKHNINSVVAVSYTHLDVYKRQLFFVISRIELKKRNEKENY
ncbi:hypothetical protein AZZ63_000442 [Enterobacter hormaechei]|nr:hypothetical protein AZZ63_000442 [Enterobacter hormaechei]